jgi:hypothetical protein
MGFFEDILSRAGRAADDTVDRLTGGPNGGVQRRADDARAWVHDRAQRADDVLARRGIHVSTLKIASAAAALMLTGTIAWSTVHTFRRATCPPAAAAPTPVEEARAASLSDQIARQKRADAEAAAAARAARVRQRPQRGR